MCSIAIHDAISKDTWTFKLVKKVDRRFLLLPNSQVIQEIAAVSPPIDYDADLHESLGYQVVPARWLYAFTYNYTAARESLKYIPGYSIGCLYGVAGMYLSKRQFCTTNPPNDLLNLAFCTRTKKCHTGR